jgi:biotin synthase-related radical SAM superfamily protein
MQNDQKEQKEDIAAKKAELINHGKINIPKGLALPFYPSRSTAGPGAGRQALVFKFYDTRVKLAIVRDGSARYSLVKKVGAATDEKIDRKCIQGKPYQILKDGKVFLAEVSLEPTLMHAPGQAFINLTSQCIYDCSFCVTPTIDHKNRSPTPERWVELILAQGENKDLEAVAITSGVAKSLHETVLDMVKVIKGVRDRLPEIPIGVEPYLTASEDVELLYQAGANEIKINLETSNREIFEKICNGLDYDGIDKALDHAVAIFGTNNVCTNLIVGLGETDDELLAKVEELASRGIVATLRGARVNQLNEPKLKQTLGFIPEPVKPERLLQLAEKQKEILEKYGLSTEKYRTMCHRCKSCDIVPQQDI